MGFFGADPPCERCGHRPPTMNECAAAMPRWFGWAMLASLTAPPGSLLLLWWLS